MDAHLKEILRTKWLKRTGHSRGGLYTDGFGYETDFARVYVKVCKKPMGDKMFHGEFESLKTILQTRTIKTPGPILTGKHGDSHFIVMDWISIRPLNRYSAELGTCLANLHLDNLKRIQCENKYVGGAKDRGVYKFGFQVPTFSGSLEQNNEWCQDWVQFFTSQRLHPQIQMVEANTNCREVGRYWSELLPIIPVLFKGMDIKPSLLHGELWIGNVGEGKHWPVAFDPASFYGHHEYDMAIAYMFNNFKREFYNCYHSLIPKANGFEERQDLYKLFHFLNHWNQLGESYKVPTLTIMDRLVKNTRLLASV